MSIETCTVLHRKEMACMNYVSNLFQKQAI